MRFLLGGLIGFVFALLGHSIINDDGSLNLRNTLALIITLIIVAIIEN